MEAARTWPSPHLPESASALATALDEKGVVELPGLVSREWIEESRRRISENLHQFGDRDHTLVDPGQEDHPPAHAIATDPALIDLLRGVVHERWPRATGAADRLPSFLRVLAGPERQETPGLLHYDAYAVTVVIPIALPEGAPGEPLGELVALANHRPFRRTFAAHALDKLVTHNRRYRRRATDRALAERERAIVRMTPGNGYAFWGYRAFHGNLPCAPGKLRATLIVHYGDPHAGNPAMRVARRLSPAWRTVRNLRPAATPESRP